MECYAALVLLALRAGPMTNTELSKFFIELKSKLPELPALSERCRLNTFEQFYAMRELEIHKFVSSEPVGQINEIWGNKERLYSIEDRGLEVLGAIQIQLEDEEF